MTEVRHEKHLCPGTAMTGAEFHRAKAVGPYKGNHPNPFALEAEQPKRWRR